MTTRYGSRFGLARLAMLLFALVAAAAGAAAAAEPSAAAIDAVISQHPRAGFSVSVVHSGKVVYTKGFGFRDEGTPDKFIPQDQNYYGMPWQRAAAPRAPADPRTIFAIGSV